MTALQPHDHLSCFQVPPAVEAIPITLNILVMLFVSVIIWRTIKGFLTKSKLLFSLKLLFYAASLCTATLRVSNLCHACFCIARLWQPVVAGFYIAAAGYIGLLTCKLGTLLARCYITFEASIYKMPRATLNALVALFAAILVLSALVIVVAPFIDVWYVLWPLLLVLAARYFVSATWAVCIFEHNVFALAHSRVTTQQFEAVEPVQLNHSQTRFVGMTAKYLLLFAVATVSTFVVVVALLVELIPQAHSQITLVLLSLDSAVNIACLFLQYSFAAAHYERYCFGADACCKKAMARRLVRGIDRTRACVYDECSGDDEHSNNGTDTVSLSAAA